MTEELREKLHGEARLQIALAKMEGFEIDKKIARFNEIVEAAIRYGLCGKEFREDVVYGGLRDAIDCCVVGDPMHAKKSSCLNLVPNWMIEDVRD